MDGGASPDDLSVLDPAPRQVHLASGLVIDVLPITVRQLVPFVRALGPAREAMAKLDMDEWVLIALYGDEIREAMSIALAMPVSAIECMRPGDYMTCLNAVLETNRDFFVSWLIRPMMAAAARKSEQPADGPMSSPDSSPTDTIPTA
jgi:hypothetical protein